VRPLFSEALGMAIGFDPAGREDWLDALALPGVLLDFGSTLPSLLISTALGVDAGLLDHDARYLLITKRGNNAELFLADPESGWYIRTRAYTSALLLSGILSRADDSAPALALDSPLYGNLAPETIVRAQTGYWPLAASNPFDIQAGSGFSPQDLILPAFKMSKYVTNMYTEADGSSVYVSGVGRLTLSPSGVVVFRAEEEEGIPITAFPSGGEQAMPTVADAYNAASEVINTAFKPLCGGASFYLLSAEELDGDGYRLRFGMMFESLAVVGDDGALDTVFFDFRGANLVGVHASLRHLVKIGMEEGGRPSYILPSELAAASLGSDGAVFMIPVYAPVSGAGLAGGIYAAKWSVGVSAP